MTAYVPPHLSASSIQQYVRCPAAYYWQRVQKQPQPPSVPMLFGSGVHKGLEAYHLDEDAFRSFQMWWDSAKRWLDDAGTPYPDTLDATGLKLLSMYDRDPIEWRGFPELSWRVQLDGLPLLLGVFDLVSQDGRLGEHKTAMWPWKEGRIEQEYQAALYAAVFERVMHTPLQSVTYTILSYQPKPLLTRHTWLPSQQTQDNAIETAFVVTRAMAAGVWEPRCPAGACSYPESCGRQNEQAESERRPTARLVTGGTHA